MSNLNHKLNKPKNTKKEAATEPHSQGTGHAKIRTRGPGGTPGPKLPNSADDNREDS